MRLLFLGAIEGGSDGPAGFRQLGWVIYMGEAGDPEAAMKQLLESDSGG